MIRRARRYEIHLPLTFNDGSVIPHKHFEDLERALVERFNGVTEQQRTFPLRGVWQGKQHRYVDQVIIMTAVDLRPSGSAKFIADVKKRLLREFDQEEIFITEISLRVH